MAKRNWKKCRVCGVAKLRVKIHEGDICFVCSQKSRREEKTS